MGSIAGVGPYRARPKGPRLPSMGRYRPPSVSPTASGSGLLQRVVAALHLLGGLAERLLQPAQGRLEVPVPRLPKAVSGGPLPECACDLAADCPGHLAHLD